MHVYDGDDGVCIWMMSGPCKKASTASSSRPRKRKVEQTPPIDKDIDKDIDIDIDKDIDIDIDIDMDHDIDDNSHSDIDDAGIEKRRNRIKMALESLGNDGTDSEAVTARARKRKKPPISGIQGSSRSRSSSSSSSRSSRRLSGEQVQFLEASFAAELRLEPGRKASIAGQLGLKPRQVAVWFQNRRARWKAQQLELEHNALKIRYEALLLEQLGLTRDSARLEEHNRRLHLEVHNTIVTL
jgi:hypothetical protein